MNEQTTSAGELKDYMTGLDWAVMALIMYRRRWRKKLVRGKDGKLKYVMGKNAMSVYACRLYTQRARALGWRGSVREANRVYEENRRMTDMAIRDAQRKAGEKNEMPTAPARHVCIVRAERTGYAAKVVA